MPLDPKVPVEARWNKKYRADVSSLLNRMPTRKERMILSATNFI
jgi:hypothetical protein